MPFRPDLDLGDFIEDYSAWFDGTGEEVQRVDTNTTYNFELPVTAEVSKVMFGPLTCSSCTDLDISPRIIWDVNGYYAALGVDPRATRAQLREAFHAVNGGESEYLTWVLQQLLDPDFRREYDMRGLGDYLIDKFIALALKKAALQEAIRRSLKTGEVDAEKVMDEMGYKIVHHEADEPPAVTGKPQSIDDEWRWSYFLHKVRCYDTDTLRQWQQMLVTALSEAGVRMQFAVGFTEQSVGLDTKTLTRAEEASSIVVAYLGALTKPTPTLAREIVPALISTPLSPHT